MKRAFFTFIIIIIFILSNICFADSKNSVYVINVKGEVNPGMYYHIKNSINKAEDESADYILLEIDTFGGRVDSSVKISDLIVSSNIPTIAFINKKAESAGVLISISCDKIYMAKSSTIGSAEPVPNTEKNISYWTSQLKTVAEEKGRDPQIVASMADKDIKIEGLVDKGKLLNLTTNKAKEINFIDGVVSSRKDIYNDLNIKYVNEKKLEGNLYEKFSKFITLNYVSIILLSLGFVGMVIELITPGFGIGGIISILGFGLFFGGSVLGGNAGYFVFFVFFIGIIFLVLEAMAPGFGVFGMLGIGSIAFSIIMASNSLLQAFIYIVFAFTVTIITLVFAIKKLPKRKISKTLFLNTKLNKKEGFVSSKEKSKYLEKEGICISYLRPSGKVQIGEEVLDVISEGAFVEIGKKVKVIRVDGSKIVVREIKEG
ncbi:NfeD family protein [Tepidibacter formicigenes]|uniref:Membrane-bound serine protease (ClpP class) n=1 Tax=Tepidibacter formicigenes DSM 15518 TaxID=1123349 RepID=A0A1M6Q3B0_9FIRM|nr:NfeD family protein [Tepidibacter formicigenes]SHK14653.1 membrane-bound serine protease (ClpP class) [Tepidibacter formicigenes DSM 15518]